ncbi:rubrerythrin family protein [Candidatus Fermentibacteria bacterium]|nr:rubrerythrin family protein [Candidatus Fermentibacteria bacterium]
MDSERLRERLVDFQRNEITEHYIYRRLSERVASEHNSEVLARIGEEELDHYNRIREVTGIEVSPVRWKIRFYCVLSRLLGLTFVLKLMERGEESAQSGYDQLSEAFPESTEILREEREHEDELLKMLDEEKLRYIGSVVLGLNDALVELTGALAGFTLALRNTRLIALTGMVTGIAAALSMAASEYLSTKSESDDGNPVKASLYTGSAYLATVVLLIFPYLVLESYYLCLGVALLVGILIVAGFNFYLSVAQDLPFGKRFLEMAGISLGVAALSFGIGLLVRIFLGVDV